MVVAVVAEFVVALIPSSRGSKNMEKQRGKAWVGGAWHRRLCFSESHILKKCLQIYLMGTSTQINDSQIINSIQSSTTPSLPPLKFSGKLPVVHHGVQLLKFAQRESEKIQKIISTKQDYLQAKPPSLRQAPWKLEKTNAEMDLRVKKHQKQAY